MSGTPDLLTPLRTPEELRHWLRAHLGLTFPMQAMCAGHDTPLEYLRCSYFEPASDVVVWGPRGGGKTRLAAAATLLDLLHKPGVQVRILGGSVEQSLRVWEHLLPDLERLVPELLEAGRSRARRIVLGNGSSAAVLTQSQRAVRGQRVQKMRCDEVELFDPRVWEAVGPTTRSMPRAHAPAVAGVVEALSTRHLSGGLMDAVVERARQAGTRVVRWCVLDVLERCPAGRPCQSCTLWDDCHGRAKATDGGGFLTIDDAVGIKRRVSLETWRAEMLCLGPSREGRVFPTFSEDRHVRAFEVGGVRGLTLGLGVDFGFAAPFVALWIGRADDGKVYVADEYVVAERTVEQHAEALRSHPLKAAEVRCDPAGRNRSEHTGESSVAVLRRYGFRVRYRSTPIAHGLELIRRLLSPAAGGVAATRLVIHPRCTRLIAAMTAYRYPRDRTTELPEKDGVHDHLIDALRYWVVLDDSTSIDAAEY